MLLYKNQWLKIRGKHTCWSRTMRPYVAALCKGVCDVSATVFGYIRKRPFPPFREPRKKMRISWQKDAYLSYKRYASLHREMRIFFIYCLNLFAKPTAPTESRGIGW